MAARKREAKSRPRGASPHTRQQPVIEEEVRPDSGVPLPVVAIGASAGGLEAFTQLLRALPADTGLAFVLIQHLDPTHPSMLVDILARSTAMPIDEATNHMEVEANRVYVIPPGVTMSMAGGMLELSPRTEPRGQHRPIDHFLRTLAEEQGHRSIGVILSGTATDGTLGLQAIKAEGGITFAQDDTAQHQSMPHSAVAAGCVDFVLPPSKIAQEIARISRHPFVAPDGEERLPEEPALGRILELLRVASGVDFASYKRNTLYRRIIRRAVLHKLEGLTDYARFLQGNPGEVDALYRDVLISVTSFFRNPEAFEVLKASVFPKLTKDRSRHEPVRVWSIGCSTGEEAYSIAIAFAEFTEAAGLQIPLQVFATDLNGAGVEKARVGLYPRTIAQDVSAARLQRFFVESDGSYRISKSIRETTVFARHNVLTDPPFSRIDLITCRNLLIYLEPTLQQKVVGVAQYALKPHGVLWLGSSETLGSYRDVFDVEDAKHKIYSRRPGPSRVIPSLFPAQAATERGPDGQSRRELGAAGVDAQREADRILLTRYVPASVLVSADLEVLQFRGDTGLFLAPAPGKASLNLLKMLREGLLVGVRGALAKATREEAPVREEGLRVKSNGGYRYVDVLVIPIKRNGGAAGPYFLVLFEDAMAAAKGRHRPEVSDRRKAGVAVPIPGRERDTSERETTRLTQELAATREYLQSVIEQQEVANEELQSSNEEVQSTNEELQSINEELETSKEEIESSNEELATVNEELQHRNVELGQSNNDFLNLLASAHLAIVMLGPDLRIRRFTPLAEKMFNLIAADVGRSITDIQLGIGVPNLTQLMIEVVDTVTVKELEVRDKEGRWHILRLRPYRTLDNRIDGVLVILIDVDALRRDQEIQRRQSGLLEQTEEPIFMWELGDGITYWNQGAEAAYGFTKAQAMGRASHELLATSLPLDVYVSALQREGHWTGELTHARSDGERVVVESRMVMERSEDRPALVFQTDHVITERKRMEETLRQRAEELVVADRNKDEFLAMLAHELRNPLAPLSNALEITRQLGAPPAMFDRAREVMSRQIQNLSRLVDDLLDVSRMTQGRIALRKEPVELLTVIERAVETSQHRLKARGQTLTLSLPTEGIYLEADVFRLEQILGNLLNNASKFMPHGGQIWLTVEDRSASPSDVVIRVRDSGMGIAPEHLSRVFNLFMQADSSSTRATGGLGIGLTLVRHLVELHGGSVEANSAGLGRGSEFVVRLPALRERPQAPVRAAGRELAVSEPVPRRVLVTDDNVDGAETLAIVLRGAGHEVRVAHSGAATLEIARDFQPQVVFLDVGMPGMDGYETVRHLRDMAGLEDTLVVALTGYGQDSDRQRAHEAGFDEFLVKPAIPEVVAALASRNRFRDTAPRKSKSAADS